MKAVRIHRYGGPEVLTFEPSVPDPILAADGVLVRTTATSVNPIDWKIRSGARQQDFPLELPAILGRDLSGVVVAVGDAVRDFAPGDRVIALADRAYAELVAVSARLLTRLPDGLDPVAAAALPLAVLTGDQLVRLATKAEPGQTILVSGALGSVGRAAVHAGLTLGATVIAGVRARQVPDAESLGVSATVAIDDDEAIAGLGPIDGVADTVGGGIAAKLLARVRPGGRFGYASVLPAGAADGTQVEVTRVFARPDPDCLRDFANALRDGTFTLPISERLSLAEAGAAHARLERGGGGKIVLLP